jgi:hypothetical protein
VVRFRLAEGAPALPAGIAADVRPGQGGTIEMPTHEPTRLLHSLTGWAIETGVELGDLTVAHASLEDAYLALVAEHAPAVTGDRVA